MTKCAHRCSALATLLIACTLGAPTAMAEPAAQEIEILLGNPTHTYDDFFGEVVTDRWRTTIGDTLDPNVDSYVVSLVMPEPIVIAGQEERRLARWKR